MRKVGPRGESGVTWSWRTRARKDGRGELEEVEPRKERIKKDSKEKPTKLGGMEGEVALAGSMVARRRSREGGRGVEGGGRGGEGGCGMEWEVGRRRRRRKRRKGAREREACARLRMTRGGGGGKGAQRLQS